MAAQDRREIQDILARREPREEVDHVAQQEPPPDTRDQRDCKDQPVAMERQAARETVDLTEIQE